MAAASSQWLQPVLQRESESWLLQMVSMKQQHVAAEVTAARCSCEPELLQHAAAGPDSCLLEVTIAFCNRSCDSSMLPVQQQVLVTAAYCSQIVLLQQHVAWPQGLRAPPQSANRAVAPSHSLQLSSSPLPPAPHTHTERGGDAPIFLTMQ